MNKYDIKVLSNGLKIIYCITPKKNIKYADLNISFGGAINQIKYNDEIINIKKGTAHLLEHLIIEDSIYGNYVKYMSSKHASFNGGTSLYDTCFYFSCVNDFEDHLKELIQLVNKPNLNKLEDVKGPIIEEIKESDHRNYKKYNSIRNKQLMNYDFYDTAGNIDDIKNYKLDELKKIYNLVYKPENQVLILRGNFNIKKICQIIEDEYQKINKDNKIYEIITNNKDSVYNKREIVNLEREDDLISLTFKIKRDTFTDDELRKLSYYFSFYSEQNFSDSSNTYNKIKDLNLSKYSIGRSVIRVDEYLLLVLSVYSKDEKIIDILFDALRNYKPDLKEFELWKKTVILDLIVQENNPRSLIDNLYDNYKTYNFIGLDDINFIKNLNIDEMMMLIKKVNLSNYSITIGVNENEDN